jgi:hypothetical protein
MNKTATVAAIFLLLISTVIVGNAVVTKRMENIEPEETTAEPDVPPFFEEAEAYFAPQTETREKEMKDFFKENKDAFNGLYEYLTENEFAMVSLTLEEGRYSWRAYINSNEQSFDFFNVDLPMPQILELLMSDGISNLGVYRGTVTVSYPRIMGTDQFATCYIDMFYRRQESPEQDYRPKDEVIETLSNDWVIVRHLLVRER